MAVIRTVKAAAAGLSKRKVQNLYKRLRRQKRFYAADVLRRAMREPVTFTGRLGAR